MRKKAFSKTRAMALMQGRDCSVQSPCSPVLTGFCFVCWTLNPESHTCQASTLPLTYISSPGVGFGLPKNTSVAIPLMGHCEVEHSSFCVCEAGLLLAKVPKSDA
jgi:hypothetical protein